MPAMSQPRCGGETSNPDLTRPLAWSRVLSRRSERLTDARDGHLHGGSRPRELRLHTFEVLARSDELSSSGNQESGPGLPAFSVDVPRFDSQERLLFCEMSCSVVCRPPAGINKMRFNSVRRDGGGAFMRQDFQDSPVSIPARLLNRHARLACLSQLTLLRAGNSF